MNPQQPQSPYDPLPPPKHHRLRTIIIILIVLLLLGAGGMAAYWYLAHQTTRSEVVTKKPVAQIDTTDVRKTAELYFKALQVCDMRTMRLLSSDKAERQKPDDFNQSQVTNCQDNVDALYKNRAYGFLQLQDQTETTVNAVFRSTDKDGAVYGDAVVALFHIDSGWYVSSFVYNTKQAAAMADSLQQKNRTSELDDKVKALIAAFKAYYSDNANLYPSAADLADDTWVGQNLKDFNIANLYYASDRSQRLNTTPDYTYDAKDCSDQGCASFTLKVKYPDGKVISKQSADTNQ